jgi:hypothetical protein
MELVQAIDMFGLLKAEIAERELKLKALKKACFDKMPVGAYEGELYRLSISESERETLDMEAVRAKLSPQFIAAHTNVTEVRTLRVSARNGKAVAA